MTLKFDPFFRLLLELYADTKKRTWSIRVPYPVFIKLTFEFFFRSAQILFARDVAIVRYHLPIDYAICRYVLSWSRKNRHYPR